MSATFALPKSLERALGHIKDEGIRAEVTDLVEEVLLSKEQAQLSKEQLLQQALLSKEQLLQQALLSKEQLLQAKEEVVLSKEQALQAKHHELLAVQEAYAERTKITTAELARTKGLLHMRGLVELCENFVRLRGGEELSKVKNRTALWTRVPESPQLESLQSSLAASVQGSWEVVVKTIVDLYSYLSERTHTRGRLSEEYQQSQWEVDIWKGVVSERFVGVLKCFAEFTGLSYRIRDADTEGVFPVSSPRRPDAADSD